MSHQSYLSRLKEVGWRPLVGVVVPGRESEKHIDTLCQSLAEQDYRNVKFYITFEEGDKTTEVVDQRFKDDPRFVFVTAPLIRPWPGRNSNRLRNEGGFFAVKNGATVLFFTDMKILHPQDWISHGLWIMWQQDVSVVGGVMKGTPESLESFLGYFTDAADLARNPKFKAQGMVITKSSFGRTESLPITACLAVTAEAFKEVGGFNPDFRDSYEDYAFDWALVNAGYELFCTSAWQVLHKHRSSLKQMRLEYVRSARGAGQMFTDYPECPFGRRRLLQSTVVAVGLISAFMLLLIILVLGLWELMLALGILGLVGYSALGIKNALSARYLPAFFFPALTVFFVIIFSYSFFKKLIEGGGVTKTDSFLQKIFYWMSYLFTLNMR